MFTSPATHSIFYLNISIFISIFYQLHKYFSHVYLLSSKCASRYFSTEHPIFLACGINYRSAFPLITDLHIVSLIWLLLALTKHTSRREKGTREGLLPPIVLLIPSNPRRICSPSKAHEGPPSTFLRGTIASWRVKEISLSTKSASEGTLQNVELTFSLSSFPSLFLFSCSSRRLSALSCWSCCFSHSAAIPENRRLPRVCMRANETSELFYYAPGDRRCNRVVLHMVSALLFV